MKQSSKYFLDDDPLKGFEDYVYIIGSNHDGSSYYIFKFPNNNGVLASVESGNDFEGCCHFIFFENDYYWKESKNKRRFCNRKDLACILKGMEIQNGNH